MRIPGCGPRPVVVGLIVILGASLGTAWHLLRRPEVTPSLRGRELARQLGCFACHGADGVGGVPDAASPGRMIPGWRGAIVEAYIRDEADLRSWILRGAGRHEPFAAGRGSGDAVPMPAYQGRLSPADLNDLMAYWRAASGWGPDMPEIAWDGRKICQRMGCFGCHGPSGMGGEPNPGSLKDDIPPWDGREFVDLVQTPAELRGWIREGRIHRLEANPLARVFLDRQAIHMPAYRSRLSDAELDQVVAYIGWLRRGPAPAKKTREQPVVTPESAPPERPVYRSPLQICVSADGLRAGVVDNTSATVSILDVRARRVLRELRVAPHPTAAAFSRDGRRLYVCSRDAAAVQEVELASGRVRRTLATGDEPWDAVLAPGGDHLYVACSLSDAVCILDLKSGRAVARIRVGRRPRFLTLNPAGTRLLVGNGLDGTVSIVDVARARVLETRHLGAASLLRQVACSRDGRWGFAVHLVAHNREVPVQIDRGFIFANGLSVLDLARPGRYVTLLLDNLLHGAANPWGLALSPRGNRLYVSLAGVHQIAVVNTDALVRLAAATPPSSVPRLAEDLEIGEQRHLVRRVPAGGLGPRGMAFSRATGELLVADYFSDAVSMLDGRTGAVRAVVPLGPRQTMSLWRRGQLLFNDGRLSFQGWMSCASCHQDDATMDGLNWDLPNDGVGNPKNVKSLHDIHDTPPAMWSGVRETMADAVAAGQRFLGFSPRPANQRALMAFLSAPGRAPNPYRKRDPAAVRRGRRAFEKARCFFCHIPPTYSDLRKHDLGLIPEREFYVRMDTPSLRECYRTAPYLHDGRARTLEEIFTRCDPRHVHGRTDRLSPREFKDLMAFLRSL